MNCLFTKVASFWDTPKSRAAAEAHASTCPICAARLRRDSQLTSRLKGGAGDMPAVHDFTIRRSVDGKLSAAPSGKPFRLSVWTLPMLSGALAAALVLVIVLPRGAKTSVATNPEEGFTEMSAGANRIADAFAVLPDKLRWNELNAMAQQVPGWNTPAQSPVVAPTRMEEIRQKVDPWGLTDDQRWKPVRALLGS